MKVISPAFLIIFFSGCALWTEITTPARPSKVSSTPDESQVKTDELKIIDEIRIKSADNKATLSVLRLSDNHAFVSVYFAEDKVNYKIGHSVELTIDGEKAIYAVEPTKSPDTLRFHEPMKLLMNMKDKKTLEVEIVTTGNQKKNFLFNVF